MFGRLSKWIIETLRFLQCLFKHKKSGSWGTKELNRMRGLPKFRTDFEPSNEGETTALFWAMFPYLEDEFVKLGFPPGEYRMGPWVESPTDTNIKVGDVNIRTELEYDGKSFFNRRRGKPVHDVAQCDLVVCWRSSIEFKDTPKVLELSKLVDTPKFSEIITILNKRQRNPKRNKPWDHDEFMDAFRQKHSYEDTQEVQNFVEDVRKNDNVMISYGTGRTFGTLNMQFKNYQNKLLLQIEDTGGVWISAVDKNCKPPRLNIPKDKIRTLRKIVKTHDDMIYGHIEQTNTKDTMARLRAVIDVLG